MSSQSIRLMAETVRTLGFAAVAAGYTGVGTSISHPARMVLIQNFTDAILMFSLDGVNDHFPMINYSHMILDIASNKTRESGFYLAEGQRLYVKQLGVPTLGSVYMTVFYGKD